MQRRVALRTLVVAVFVLLLGTQVSAAPQPGQVHFTTVGDFAQTANTAGVLDALKAADGDFAITLGDTDLDSARRTLEFIGQERFLGSVTLPPEKKK